MEVNDNFIKWSGSRTIAIPFDISEEELIALFSKGEKAVKTPRNANANQNKPQDQTQTVDNQQQTNKSKNKKKKNKK